MITTKTQNKMKILITFYKKNNLYNSACSSMSIKSNIIFLKNTNIVNEHDAEKSEHLSMLIK